MSSRLRTRGRIGGLHAQPSVVHRRDDCLGPVRSDLGQPHEGGGVRDNHDRCVRRRHEPGGNCVTVLVVGDEGNRIGDGVAPSQHGRDVAIRQARYRTEGQAAFRVALCRRANETHSLAVEQSRMVAQTRIEPQPREVAKLPDPRAGYRDQLWTRGGARGRGEHEGLLPRENRPLSGEQAVDPRPQTFIVPHRDPPSIVGCAADGRKTVRLPERRRRIARHEVSQKPFLGRSRVACTSHKCWPQAPSLEANECREQPAHDSSTTRSAYRFKRSS